MVDRGCNLHNHTTNKTGVVLDGSNTASIVVMTVSGKEVWHIDNCQIIEDLDLAID